MTRPADGIRYTGEYLQFSVKEGFEVVDRVNTSGVVMILARTQDDKVLLVEQYRPAVGAPCLEVPAGLVGDTAEFRGEDMAVAAQRELEEETGYRAESLELVAHGPTTAGMSSETIHLYRASGLERVGEGGGDHSEDITVHQVPVAEMSSFVEERRSAGVQIDLKLYSALYFL